MPSSLLVPLLATVMILSACTRVEMVRTAPEAIPSGSLAATREDDGWWSIAFHVQRDPEQAVDWYLDTLLADQICAPARARFRPRIGLWRFHRRAAGDDVGHRFSLLIYTDETTANALHGHMTESTMLAWLEEERRVATPTLARLVLSGPPPVAHSSDRNWPPEIQASWPWYIMGVSQTWLSLIDQVKAEKPLSSASGEELLEYYQEVNERVTALWRDYGQHVYLHHLNALFGYAPLVIRETNLKRF